MRNNLLIIGATSGIIISCLESFLKNKYKIIATYSKEESLSNIPNKFRKSKNISFVKLDLNENDEKILGVLKKNKIKADMIINAVGGSFGIKDYPYSLDNWQKLLNLNILKHIFHKINRPNPIKNHNSRPSILNAHNFLHFDASDDETGAD